MIESITIGPLFFENDGNELYVYRLADPNVPDGDGDHIGTCEVLPGDWEEFRAALARSTEHAACRTDGIGEATRLLGFALFNHHKGNADATETLMRKAYKALTGRGWDE